MTWQPAFLKHLETRSKLSHLAALTAMEDLQAKAAESQRNSEAESAAVRRSLWGEDVAKQPDEEMRTTILGDVTHPAPVVFAPQQQAQSSLMPLAMMALAAALPATGAVGVVGYLLANKATEQAVVQPAEQTAVQPLGMDSTVKIGLGRIEDFEK
jgi:hypothetical protein